jgi:hypothetical protein
MTDVKQLWLQMDDIQNIEIITGTKTVQNWANERASRDNSNDIILISIGPVVI